MTRKIPEGYSTITPCIYFKNTRKAIEFYKKAFGAKELMTVQGPDGKSIMHAEIQIGNSRIMMGDENPKQNGKSAESLGTSPVTFYAYVEDADAAIKKATDAGASLEMPPQDMFWGDRMGAVKDIFGYHWTFATHIRDISKEEMEKASKEFTAQMAK